MNRRAAPFSPPPIVPIWRGRPIPEIKALHDSLDRYHQYLVDRMNDLIGPNGIINTGNQGAGTNIASAPTISISDFLHNVTGAQTISTINPPLGFSAPTILFSQDGFSLASGGNILMPVGGPVQVPAGSYAQVVYHANVGMWKTAGLGNAPTATGVKFSPVVLGVAGSPHTMVFGEFLLASASAGTNFIAKLPAATGSGLVCMVKKMDGTSGSVVLTPAGADTVDGRAPVLLVNQNYALTVVDYAAGKWAIGAFY